MSLGGHTIEFTATGNPVMYHDAPFLFLVYPTLWRLLSWETGPYIFIIKLLRLLDKHSASTPLHFVKIGSSSLTRFSGFS